MKPALLWLLLWKQFLFSESTIRKAPPYTFYGDTTIVFKSLVEPPFLFNRSDIYTRRRYSGLIPDLVHLVSERLRRPYRLYLVPYEGYGVPDRKVPGRWTGLIGDVISGIADVAAAPLTKTFSRQAVVDFTTPFMESGIAALYLYRNTLDGASWPKVIESPLFFSDKNVELVAINGSLTNYYIESERLRDSATGNALRHMLRARPKRLVWTKAAGIRRVIESRGDSIFLLEKPFADYAAATEIGCRLRATSGVIPVRHAKHYAFAVKKANPLLVQLNRVLDELRRDGTVDRLVRKWWAGKCNPVTRFVSGDRASENQIRKKGSKDSKDMLMDDNMVSSYHGTGIKMIMNIFSLGCCLIFGTVYSLY